MTLPAPYYQDDFCTIYHGDSRELLPLLDADVMVTDPPYGIAHRKLGACLQPGRITRSGASIDGDLDTSARDAVLSAWGDRPAVAFGSPLIAPPRHSRQTLVWHKDDGGVGIIGNVRGWRKDWEAIYLLGCWPINRAADSSVISLGGNRSAARSTGHPHTKPQSLMRYLIERCPPGAIIDPFMGSGSTLLAAKTLGRKCIGIEVDEKWCDVAVRRLAQDNLFAGGAA